MVLVFAILGQMTYLVADLTPDCARSMEQQGDDVASWWPWNVFEVPVSFYGDVMEVLGNSFGRKNSRDSDGGLIIGGGMGIEEGVKVA
nr:hypothetical protein [Tanacetum cinerariifolium]